MSAALTILAISLAAAGASAQEPRELGTTDHGRVSRGGTLPAARDAARRAGLDCEVVAAVLRGRSEDGGRQYEVVCRDRPGFLIVEGRAAYNCLALEGQNQRIRRGERSGPFVPTCRHSRNRNPLPHFVRMAREAGVNCRIDEGLAIGLSPAGSPIYELGCRGGMGAWIEQTSAGWVVTDCLAIRGQGGLCRFTTREEELADFRGRLESSGQRDCRPTRLRGMGRNAEGLTYYEASCAGAESIVVALDAHGAVSRVVPCADASYIGGGCEIDGPGRDP